MVISHLYGHPTYYDETADCWRYQDTHEVVSIPSTRPCPQCRQLPTPEGHDACLGTIPGAHAACCGHGVEDGYISWGIGQSYAEFSIFSLTLFGWTFELLRRRPATEDEAVSGWAYD